LNAICVSGLSLLWFAHGSYPFEQLPAFACWKGYCHFYNGHIKTIAITTQVDGEHYMFQS